MLFSGGMAFAKTMLLVVPLGAFVCLSQHPVQRVSQSEEVVEWR